MDHFKERLNAVQLRFRELGRRFWWLTIGAWIAWELLLDRAASSANQQLDDWAIPAAGLFKDLLAPLGFLIVLVCVLLMHAYFDTRHVPAARSKAIPAPKENADYIDHDGVTWEIEGFSVTAGPLCPKDLGQLIFESNHGIRGDLHGGTIVSEDRILALSRLRPTFVSW
jgi:hypothetical protein